MTGDLIIVYDSPSQLDWYVKALEIVVETCDYVLAKSDPECYFLHWSG